MRAPDRRWCRRRDRGSSWCARAIGRIPARCLARLPAPPRSGRGGRGSGAASGAPLIEVRRVSQGALPSVVRDVLTRVERGGTELPPLIHRIELQVEGGPSLLEQARRGHLYHPLQGLETGV